MTYDILKSAFLKKTRNERQLKLEAISSLTCYSVSYISELERNKKRISDSDWSTIFSSLDISILPEKEASKYLCDFSKLYELIHFMKKNEAKKLYISFHEDICKNSFLFLDYHLVSFIYFLSERNIKIAKIHLQSITPYINYLEPTKKYVFDIYYASYLMFSDKISEALILLEKLEALPYKVKYVTSMLHYYLSSVYFLKNNLLTAYYQIHSAEIMYLADRNIYRYCISLKIEANLFSEQRNYIQANNIYEEVISIMPKEVDEVSYYTTFSNYSYALIKQGNYKKALDALACCEHYGQQFNQIILNTAWCKYYINHEECLSYLDTIELPKDAHPYFVNLLKVIRLLIENNTSSEISNLLTSLCINHQNDLDSNAKELILNLLLEYYQRTNNTKKENKTLRALVALYRGDQHE